MNKDHDVFPLVRQREYRFEDIILDREAMHRREQAQPLHPKIVERASGAACRIRGFRIEHEVSQESIGERSNSFSRGRFIIRNGRHQNG
jgi:hypothetical protein